MDWVICLNLKVTENSMFHFQLYFWFVRKAQVSFVKLQLLSQYNRIPLHIHIFLVWEFFITVLAGCFSWSLNYTKSSQHSRTLLSILVNLNNAVVCMVSTHILISKSASPCTKKLVTVPKYLSLFPLPSVLPCGQPERQGPLFDRLLFALFLLTITRSGRLTEIGFSVCISKSRLIFLRFIF